MAATNRDRVIQDLVVFFKSRCAVPSLIKGETSNAKHLCGYDGDTAGWRLLSVYISDLPYIQSRGYWLSATAMDRVATIGQIADALINSAAQKPAPLSVLQRQGRAGFLPPRSAGSLKAGNRTK